MLFKSILTVCIGNMCRSPLAEAALKLHLPHLTISSAGLEAPEGSEADEGASAAALEAGYDLSSHRARLFSNAIAADHDLILVMERRHRNIIAERFTTQLGKTFLLTSYDGQDDIPDPYLETEEIHRRVRDRILKATTEWVERLK